MKTGKVKFFKTDKGFGFIIDSEGKDIFVHATDCIDSIKQDDLVSYEIGSNKKGECAVKVKKI